MLHFLLIRSLHRFNKKRQKIVWNSLETEPHVWPLPAAASAASVVCRLYDNVSRINNVL